MATKKSGGSTRNGRDSCGKRLGIKVYGGQFIKNGSIIVRQRGNTVLPYNNVGQGSDYTLYALKDGIVSYYKKKETKKVYVSII